MGIVNSRHTRRLPALSAAELAHPVIEPITDGAPRPLVSVMIPTFNCAHLLGETLRSVLAQDLGPDAMQIEVIDDCSTADDPEAVVREVGQGRVGFVRNERNLGANGNFNHCLRRSRGELVHVLHGDDYVLPGFYDEIRRLATAWPAAGLYATRTFVIDDAGVRVWTTERLPQCEHTASRDPGLLGWRNKLQFVTTVMRRSAVEESGGFLDRLVHTADWEMWLRLTARHGLVRSPEVLGCYREFAGSDTSRLTTSAVNVLDADAFVAAARAQGLPVDAPLAMAASRKVALAQYGRFRAAGHGPGAKAAFGYWVRRATPRELGGFVWAGARRRAITAGRRLRHRG